MPSPKKAAIHTDRKFEISPDQFIPLRIYQEIRNGYRATVGKNHLIFRLPHGLLPRQQQEFIDSLSNWARTTFQKNPAAFTHLFPIELNPESNILIMDTNYRVEIIEETERATHFGTLKDLTDPPRIIIELARMADSANKSKAVRSLLSRLSANKYLPEITERVHELNKLHFRQPIKEVKLRLTQSRWGSCSSTGNINLSSRLLLVPPLVRDSVIIHELAHRIEMNHSPRFWKLVYDAMPDYEKHHLFLDNHGKKYVFVPK